MLPRTLSELTILVDSINPDTYAKTRNHLTGAVTKLSPYISRGVLPLPYVRERLLHRHTATDCEKLLQELAWREYFQLVWKNRGEDIFADLRFPRADWRHHDLVAALVQKETGILTIDTAIAQLYTTGYMHNHARLWVAGMACNIARAHWFSMGKWLYYHLYDGDLASNFLSWQWVAGTSVQKRYSVNQDLINCWSIEKQQNTWLSRDRDATLTMETPAVLRIPQSFRYTTLYPQSTCVQSVANEIVFLYTPWTLNPFWRPSESARRILVIDPVWFDRFPVSPSVMQFIISQAVLVLPALEIWVGGAQDIPGVATAARTYHQYHPTAVSWPGATDEIDRLYPSINDYYPSFYKFWQAVQARS